MVSLLFEKAKERFGRIDIAINTVGQSCCASQSWKQAKTSFDSMFDIKCKDSLFLYSKERQASPRQWKNHLAGDVSPGGLTRWLLPLCGRKAPVDTSPAAARQGHFSSRGSLGDMPSDKARWTTPFFYGRQETPEAGGLFTNPGDGNQLTQIEEYCFRLWRFLAPRADGLPARRFSPMVATQHVKIASCMHCSGVGRGSKPGSRITPSLLTC